MQRNVLNYAKDGQKNIPDNKIMTAEEMQEIYDRATRTGGTMGDILFNSIEEAFFFGCNVGRLEALKSK